jgi:hypothetical protein
VAKYDSSGGTFNKHLADIRNTTASKSTIVFRPGTGDVFVRGEDGTVPTTQPTLTYASGEWHRYTVVANGTNVITYCDTTQADSKSFNGNLYNINSWRIASDASASNLFKGSIANIVVYTRALSPTEITALYNNQYVSPTGLVASWKPYQPSTDIDFFLHTHRPKSLVYRRDESGQIYEVDLFPGNGLLYHGRLFHCNPLLDSDSDLVPDVLNQNIHFSTQDGQLFTASDGSYFDVPMTTLNGSLFQFLQNYGMIV